MYKKLLAIQSRAESIGYSTDLHNNHINILLEGLCIFTYDASCDTLFSYSTQHLKDLGSSTSLHYVYRCLANNIQSPPILPDKILKYVSKVKNNRFLIRPAEDSFAILDTHNKTSELNNSVSRAANIAVALNNEWHKFIKYNKQYETWEQRW